MSYLFLFIAILFFVTAMICLLLISWTSLFVTKNKIHGNHRSKDTLTIFMITNNYTPYSGGVVTALDSYSAHLRSQGHTVVLITPDFLGTKQSDEEDVIHIWCPIRFKYYNNHMAIPWRPTKKIFNLAVQFKPDIIHVFHPFLLGASGLKVGKKLNIPVVFTYMTLYDRYVHYVPLPTYLTLPITKYVVDNFCSKVDLLIAPSESASKYINYPMQILPLSILDLYLKPMFTLKSAHKKFTLLFVSRFTQEKNIYYLLDVFNTLDQNKYDFILIGFGSEEEALKNYAYQKLNLSPDSVQFITQPSKDAICAWYDNADLFIFASTSETQGLVLAEAMARGTPVVSVQASGVSDIVRDGVNGYMVTSKNEMKDSIESIATDQALFEKLQYGAWCTGNTYSAKNCTAQLLNLYSQLLKA